MSVFPQNNQMHSFTVGITIVILLFEKTYLTTVGGYSIVFCQL